MIISCPSCDTAYNLPEDAISSEGRKIRCKRCSHVFWARRIPRPLSHKPKIEIFYPNQPKPTDKKTQNRRETVESVSHKRKAISEFDKRHVRNTLGDLFGASIANVHQSTISDDAPTPIPSKISAPRVEGHGTILGVRAQGRQNSPTSAPSTPTKSHQDPPSPKGTSYGLPVVPRDNTGNTPIPSTTHGMPSVKNDLRVEDTPIPEPRKRQATLWMLGDDEVSSADIARALDDARAKTSLADENEGELKSSSSPLQSVDEFEEEPPKDLATRGGFGRESTLHLEIALDSEEDFENLNLDKVIPEKPETSRRSVTLFGLASPMSKNADGIDDVDEDLARFLRERQGEQGEEPPHGHSGSGAEYEQPLKPNEIDTGRRLAKFLVKKSKGSSGEHESVEGENYASASAEAKKSPSLADDPKKRLAEGLRKSRTGADAGSPTATPGSIRQSLAGGVPGSIRQSLAGGVASPTAVPGSIRQSLAGAAPGSIRQSLAGAAAAAGSTARKSLSGEAPEASSIRQSLSGQKPAVGKPPVAPASPAASVAPPPTGPAGRPKLPSGSKPVIPAAPELPKMPVVPPDSPTELLNVGEPETRPVSVSDPATEETRELDRSIDGSHFPDAFPTGLADDVGGAPTSSASKERLIHQSFPPGGPNQGPPSRNSRNTIPPQAHRGPGMTTGGFGNAPFAAPGGRPPFSNNPRSNTPQEGGNPWKQHPTQRPLFDQTENTDIIPRDATELHPTPKPNAGNLFIWLVSFLIVLVAGMLVAWFIVMKLM